jgi:hypothetical protein
MGRSLAILSEGRLSESQKRTLTLLSLGWIEVTMAPVAEPEDDGVRKLGVIYTGPERNLKNEKLKKLQEDDEVIFSIIATFVQWQESRVA